MENWSSFHNLAENPFGETPDTRFFYCSEQHKTALSRLAWMIAEGKGFALLTGDVGTGKTLLCRMLLKTLKDKANTALILHPIFTATELLDQIADEFGVMTKPSRSKSPKIALERLNNFLIAEAKKKRKSIVVIDDAQRLPQESLELIRLLSNLETERQKLLHIILVAQPELQVALKTPELRQLGQRIAVNPTLHPMDLENTEAYIRHRIEKAGGANFLRFHPKAVRRIFAESGGVPRLVNKLCERLVIEAEVRKVRFIEIGLVKEVLRAESEPRGFFQVFHRRSEGQIL